MTAAVPDPRFRDQLAETAAGLLYPGLYPSEAIRRHPAQIERVAAHLAEVEARVQAAANQRAAEELRAAADLAAKDRIPVPCWTGQDVAQFLRARAAALASPAPAPRAEEGQHACSRWCAQHTALGGPLDAAEPTGELREQIPYMLENTREEFERVRDLAWPAPALDAEAGA